MARVRFIKEVKSKDPQAKNLFFQWCQYLYDDGSSEYGFRFIWRRDDNSLQGARGQARIPSVKIIKELIDKATEEGWAENTDEDVKDW